MSADLNEAELRIYLFLKEKRRPMGLREVARELNLPVSTVHYNLRKLVGKGYVVKNIEGYMVKGSVNMDGFIQVGYKVIPRLLLLYSVLYMGVAIGTIISITIYGFTLEKVLLLIIAVFTSLLMLYEGYLLRRRLVKHG